jgi:hypothetical protein
MLGVTEASILLDRPPGGWNDLATKGDLAALESRLDRRFEALEDGIDLRISSAVNRAIASQTRWIVGVVLGAISVVAVLTRF